MGETAALWMTSLEGWPNNGEIDIIVRKEIVLGWGDGLKGTRADGWMDVGGVLFWCFSWTKQENVHQSTKNLYTLHTSPGCSLPPVGRHRHQTGKAKTDNCDVRPVPPFLVFAHLPFADLVGLLSV